MSALQNQIDCFYLKTSTSLKWQKNNQCKDPIDQMHVPTGRECEIQLAVNI